MYTNVPTHLHSNKELCLLITRSQSLHFVWRSTIGADGYILPRRMQTLKDHIVVRESIHTEQAVLVAFVRLREGEEGR